MANETTNSTTNETNGDGNVTQEIVEVVEESGLLDDLLAQPELLVALGVIGILAAYVLYTQPTLRALVLPFLNKYLKRYDAQIDALLEENLTKAQQTVFNKLDATLQAQVKDEVLRNIILSTWDEKDDELKSLVKGKVKTALNNNRR